MPILDIFFIENLLQNRGHLDEKPGNSGIRDIVDKMQAFIKKER